MDQTQALGQSSQAVVHSQAGPSTGTAVVATLAAQPSNELTLLTGRFVSAMAVTDIGFDLSIYGFFFAELPQRLGRNKALDASVEAMVVALPSLRTHQTSAEILRKYTEALKCLRTYLTDPATATTPDTMCAVYLVMICQVRHSRSEEARRAGWRMHDDAMVDRDRLTGDRAGSVGAATLPPTIRWPFLIC